jgi:hypothetical protein
MNLFKRRYGTTKYTNKDGQSTITYDRRDFRHPLNINKSRFNFINRIVRNKDKTWNKKEQKWLTEYIIFNFLIVKKYEITRGNGCRTHIVDRTYKLKTANRGG